MKFFKKMKFKIALNKTLPFGFILPALSFLMLFTFMNSFGNGTPLDFSLLLYSVLFSGLWVVFIMLRMNNNEYKELVRQAELIGDLDTVGNMIDNLKRTPVKGGTLKFNPSLIFYSDTLATRIIVPARITSIEASSNHFRCMHYNVGISYLYEGHVTIEVRSMAEARELCALLKRTVAPHLLGGGLDD